MWPSLVGRLDGVQEVAGSNPVIPTMRVCSSVVEHVVDIHGVESSILSTPTILGSRLMVGLQILNLTMVVRSHPPQPKKRSLSEMDITEVYETSSPSSTLGETATSTHGETDIMKVFETFGPGSTPGGCSNYFFLRFFLRLRGAGTNLLGFWRMRK